MSDRAERLALAALSALLDAPPALADAGLDAWREWGARYREWYENERNPLVNELDPAEPLAEPAYEVPS